MFGRISFAEICRRMGRRKSMKEAIEMKTELRRCLNVAQLTLNCIAYIIGGGLYALAGELIHDVTGPATAVTFIISAAAIIFTALCYTEFVTIFTKTGSIYLYTYMTLGELAAFMTGYGMIISVLTAISAIAKSFSDTINVLSNDTIRLWSKTNLIDLGESQWVGSTPDLIAGGFLVLLILLTITGANFSMTLNSILSSLQIASLIAMFIAFFVLGNPVNYQLDGGYLPFGLKGLLKGSALAIFAVSGFESIANAAEEAKNPNRDIPIALLLSVFICVTLYVLMASGLCYMVPRQEVSSVSTFVAAFKYVDQPIMVGIATFGSVLATGATKLAVMYAVPRVIYAVASDGLIFKCFSKVEKRTKVPLWGLFIGGTIATLLGIFINSSLLANVSTIFMIFYYYFVGLDLMLFRYNSEEILTPSNLQIPLTEIDECSLSQKCTLRKQIPRCFGRFGSAKYFKSILALYSILTLVDGLVLNLNLHYDNYVIWGLFVVTALLTLLCFVALCLYKPNRMGNGFQTPFMPLTPCVAILINAILITSMASFAWIQFAICVAIGLFIYFAYGMWHSKVDIMTGTEWSSKPSYSDIDQKSEGDSQKVGSPTLHPKVDFRL